MAPHSTGQMSEHQVREEIKCIDDFIGYDHSETSVQKNEELNRGRQMRTEAPLEYQTFTRHNAPVKNIPRKPSHPGPSPLQRSREASIHTLSDDPYRHHSISRESSPKTDHSVIREQDARRPSKLRNAFSVFTDNTYVDTVAPARPHIAYQRFQKQQRSLQSIPSITSTKSFKEEPNREVTPSSSVSRKQSTTKKKKTSVSIDDGIVPAFGDLSMDMEGIDTVDNHADIDNTFKSISGDETDDRLNSEVSNADIEKASKEAFSTGQIGRIQQRLIDLKAAAEKESENNFKRFENIEQKVMFEYMSNDLRNLRRFNQNPLLESLERTQIQIHPPEPAPVDQGAMFIKFHDPLMHMRDCSLNRHHSKSHSKPPDITKMKELLKNSSSQLEALWEETDNKKSSWSKIKSSLVSASSLNTAFSISPTVEHNQFIKLPETAAIKHQFEGFVMGHEPSRKITMTDPSPKTLKK